MPLKKLPDNFFKGMKTLKEVQLPLNLEWIGSNSLNGTGITSIAIPEGVYYIGDHALANNKIDTIILESKNLGSTSFIASDPFLNTRYYIKSVTITQLDSIPANMFHETPIESIELPPSVEEIGSYAFHACYNL